MNKENVFEKVNYDQYIIYRTFINNWDTVIYILDIRTIKMEPENFKGRIPTERYQKMMKYRFKTDKMLLIGNEILFQYGYKQHYNGSNNNIGERSIDKYGKPYITGIDSLYFNMSHTGYYSVCAFSTHPIGIDIEMIKPIEMSIAKRYFRKEEYNEIIQLPESLRLKKFYQYWVLKESFIKAVGLGLSIPLNTFCFCKNLEDKYLKVEHKLNSHKYISWQFTFSDQSCEIAVCIEIA